MLLCLHFACRAAAEGLLLRELQQRLEQLLSSVNTSAMAPLGLLANPHLSWTGAGMQNRQSVTAAWSVMMFEQLTMVCWKQHWQESACRLHKVVVWISLTSVRWWQIQNRHIRLPLYPAKNCQPGPRLTDWLGYRSTQQFGARSWYLFWLRTDATGTYKKIIWVCFHNLCRLRQIRRRVG